MPQRSKTLLNMFTGQNRYRGRGRGIVQDREVYAYSGDFDVHDISEFVSHFLPMDVLEEVRIFSLAQLAALT